VASLHAAELHRLARKELGPTLVALGFKRTPSTAVAAWLRPEGERWLVLWVQPWRSSGTASTGEFTVELRLSSRPETGGDGPRRRLPKLLSDAEREELRRNRWAATRSPDDLWFSQSGEADAQALMAFLARALPDAINRFLV
jgi:hypothetical protein